MHPAFVLLTMFVVTSVVFAETETNTYLKAGVPAATREWIGNDYIQASTILMSGKVPLPRVSNKHGAALLNRITSQENASLHRDRSLPLQVRFQDWLNVHNSVSSLQKFYLDIDLKSGRFSDETARLMGYSLHTAALGMELTDELLATKPDAKLNASAMESLRKMRLNLTGMFVGAEISLAEDGGFSAAARSTILDAMANTLPTFKKSFDKDYRAELRSKLQARKGKLASSDALRKVDAMIRELSN